MTFLVRQSKLNGMPTFHRKAYEEPYLHLSEFNAICSTISSQGFTADEVKLVVFQFSLKDLAKQWFLSLLSASNYMWQDMAQQFLDEYYAPQRTSEARTSIINFQQGSGKSFHEAFARFKRLLRTCPHHGIALWELIKVFHDGLSSDDVRDLQSTTSGSFLSNDENEEWQHLEIHAMNSKRQAQSNRMVKREVVKAVDSGKSDDRMARLERKLDQLMGVGTKEKGKPVKAYPICECYRGIGHVVATCGVVMEDEEEEEEEVNFVQGERRYNNGNMNSNTYHPGLRNHPNFSYGNLNTQQNLNFQGNSQKTCYQSNQRQYGNERGTGQSGYNQKELGVIIRFIRRVISRVSKVKGRLKVKEVLRVIRKSRLKM
ncbi:uncharacterized protein LOC143549368 [Bidens hawaiensis]|uniref:uncharacterized protein LOC143549368 n=1 Tax=Bidens hawaiensis TaxID=980011 RepID=UPI00404A9D92